MSGYYRCEESGYGVMAADNFSPGDLIRCPSWDSLRLSSGNYKVTLGLVALCAGWTDEITSELGTA